MLHQLALCLHYLNNDKPLHYNYAIDDVTATEKYYWPPEKIKNFPNVTMEEITVIFQV